MKKELLTTAIWLLAMLFSINCLSQTPVVKKSVDQAGITTLTYTINGKPSKIIRFNKDGLRHGISEEWHYDEDTPEVHHLVYLYEEGVLKEFSMVFGDGKIISKNVYYDGVLVEHTTIDISRSKFPDDLHYVKQVYTGSQDYMQYRIANGVVTDSLFVPHVR